MTATTLSLVDGFEKNVEVLDHMMRTLVRVEPSGSAANCSAAGMSGEPIAQPGLPSAVQEMRTRIVEAAVACDFDRLAALAPAGESRVTYSFGDGGDPADHWRREEAGPGPRPLRYLVGVLNRPHRRIELHHDQPGRYVWPSAFGYDSWKAVPQEANNAHHNRAEPNCQEKRSMRGARRTVRPANGRTSTKGETGMNLVMPP